MRIATGNHRSILLFAGIHLLLTTQVLYGQLGVVPDANTLFLDHFNGSATGEIRGPVSFSPSQAGLGQAVNLGPGAFIKYKLTDAIPVGTIEMWVNPRRYDALILNANQDYPDTTPSGGYYYHLTLDQLGHVQNYPCGGGYRGTPSKAIIPLNTWTHIAVSFSQQQYRLYINGELDHTSNITQCGIVTPQGGIFLNYWGTTDFGLIDELHISKVERPADEIKKRLCGVLMSLRSIHPKSGGNTGTATAELQGCRIAPGVVARLVGINTPDIAASSAMVSPFGTIASLTFDLRGAALGLRDLVVRNPDGTSVTLAGAFTVEPGGNPDIEVVPDANTLFLDHFNGSTTGEIRGPVSFSHSQTGLGQAVNLGPGAFIKYKLTEAIPVGTIEMWVNPRRYGALILNANQDYPDTTPSGGYYYHLTLDQLGHIQNYPCGGGYRGTPSKAIIPLNTWTHIAVSFSQQQYRLYINGELDHTSNITQCGIVTPQGGIFLNYWGTTDFGLIDELHISKVERPADEIKKRLCGVLMSLRSIHPKSGGNTGTVTLQVQGCRIATGAVARLVHIQAPDIVAFPVTVSPFGTIASLTFDTRGATPGLRSLVVTNPDGTSVSLPNTFTVESGGVADVAVEIIGPQNIRVNRPQTYYVVVTNRGAVDGLVSFDPELEPTKSSASANAILSGPCRFEPPLLATVAPHSSAVYSGVCQSMGGCQIVSVNVTDHSENRACNAERLNVYRKISDLSYLRDALQKAIAERYAKELIYAVLLCYINPDGFGCADLRLEIQRLNVRIELLEREFADAERALRDAEQALRKCLSENANASPKTVTLARAAGQSRQILGSLTICGVTSVDPNDKTGPLGIGASHFIVNSVPVPYLIRFENKPTATAPAEVVEITDQLDSTRFDFSTLTLGPITFTNNVVTPPSIPLSVLGTYTTTVDLRPAKNLIVSITADLNTATGILRWRFESLDPTTGKPPTGVDGFLPPGGNGSVFFTARMRDNLLTGTQIRNKASIVFDTNAPILTPEWLNTIDVTAPISKVTALSPTQANRNFTVQWSGTDQGAGVGMYDVLVSDNNAPSTAWQTQTSTTQATFNGVVGHTYKFFSIARDFVGNTENPKTAAEAMTTIVVPQAPCSFALSPTSITVPPTGTYSTSTLTVTGTNCNWTASSNASWAQVYPLNGSSTAPVSYTIFPNFSTCVRTATLAIAGRTLVLTQPPYLGSEDERFVGQMYFNAFGRVASPAEIAFQVAELRKGVTRGDLSLRFMETPEFNNGARFVAGLYVGLLGRDAEYGGWLFQRNALATGAVTQSALVNNFIGSQEYSAKFGALDDAAFVRQLYRQVLLREASQAEVDFQVDAIIASNMRGELGRVIVAQTFLTAREFQQGKGPRLTAFLMYAFFLLRGPSPSDLDFQAGIIAAANGNLLPIVNSFLATGEHQSVLQCPSN